MPEMCILNKMREGPYFVAKVALPVMFVLALTGAPFASGHDLVIYHTNDVHGYAFEEPNTGARLTRLGYDRLKAILESDKTRRKLLVDSGDTIHGQPFAIVRHGGFIASVLSLVGYDALAVGNHDFGYGYRRLKYLAEKYKLNFLAANVVETTPDGQTNFILPPYIIRTLYGLKIGIFALSTPETPKLTDLRNVAGLSFQEPTAVALEMVKQLKAEGAELIIALTHMGNESYNQPSSQSVAVKVSGMDLIVDGHSHSRLAQRVAGPDGWETLIVSTGSYFENLGRVYVDRKPEGGFSFRPEILPAASFEDIKPDAGLNKVLDSLRVELEAELGQVVMNIPFALDGSRDKVRSQSTSLGRVICAALLEATGAEVALINGGAIRGSFAPGAVTKGDLLAVLPYEHDINVLEISGVDLLATLNHGLARPGSGAFPQFGGLTVTAEEIIQTGQDGSKKKALEARSVLIGGQPLELGAKYRLATIDFLQRGGDGYEMLTKSDYREFGTLVEALKRFLTESNALRLKKISGAEVLQVR